MNIIAYLNGELQYLLLKNCAGRGNIPKWGAAVPGRRPGEARRSMRRACFCSRFAAKKPAAPHLGILPLPAQFLYMQPFF
ncbi:MAG: hypothetical protein DBY09_00020 [Selenomonadales bacterium]|nr:MAG: hypothetical protein DBY09_00020 [Selenomonadales bacterium]